MTTTYTLKVQTTAGVEVAQSVSFDTLTYTKHVNEPGLAHITFRADDAIVPYFVDKALVEVWRENADWGLARACDFWGIVRKVRRYYSDQDMLEVYAPGQMSLLSWRTVDYAANTTGRSVFTHTAPETVMKELVKYNATASGTTADGRKRLATIAGITIQTDGAAGTHLDWACSNDNLLQTLQSLALVAGGDFDLVNTGAAAWNFRWYLGQLGTDRRASLWFGLDRGNMAESEYTWDHINEATVAIVGGQGQDTDRVYEIRTGADYVSGTSDYEVFVDARDCTTTAALDARGDARLDDMRAKQAFTFKAMQTATCAYGIHYYLGDLATAYYADITDVVKVTGVTVAATKEGGEAINIETESV